MGCASSKHLQIQAQEVGWDAPLKRSPLHNFSRSFSLPLRPLKSPERSPFHVVALTSSTYGALKMETREHAAGEVTVSSRGKPELQHEKNSDPSITSRESQQLTKVKVRSAMEALEPSEVADVINVWELMEDLEEEQCSAVKERSREKNTKVYGRSFSSSQAQKIRKLNENSYQMVDFSGEMPSEKVYSAKAINADKERLKSRDGSASLFSHNRNIKGLFYGASLFTGTELDSQKGIPEENACEVAEVSASPDDQSKIDAGGGYSTPNRYNANDTESLRFDPEILNSVEKAVLSQMTGDDWCYIKSDGEVDVFSETESSVVAKCLFPEPEDEHLSAGGASNKKNKIPMALEVFNKALTNKKFSSSKVSAIEVEEKKLNLNGLEKFEIRCPPGGEERVVLYFTSLRGIRKTYEDYNNMRMTLQGFNIKIDERDVSMHSGFRKELKDLLEKPLPVPRLFIKGRYIGGVEELLQLNEDGLLAKLLDGLPRETSGKTCEGCGGVRFIPCPTCSGSCKIISDTNEVVRCPDCNENGLLRCPICF
ncbi:hypothetical protein O6H91_13G084200 [Diphasiastrum complanatum]|uniref:Uncharacterized protein n=6 Tax=Diphasiastrum complanatum TaxID=34168 RepID=A0ACC2BWP9_DIPCM|nr:hypothetical protein O6H91_13G083200 [Diphasiastrum complanatum]KAJ7534188.1 hypothetical protein O6H91_13G083200 [Diphasiastrum complanatum]KAJ7534189.1 hypothetical protein O6H91_13G083200 [Diphasiastrum complanatum]KAJ7534190.1 hypothetical protein O6H91_13G083200 [Diphasiastrum complanatum]KAJ7534220.1 hypothetical protein O6H91_13G084200 [Diphasiastrum complanatum]